MSNLKKSQQTSEIQTQTSKRLNTLTSSMALALERTNTPVFNLQNLVNDINTEFIKYDTSIITSAIRKGSLGEYGRTYRFSTQEVCIWIRNYVKTNPVPKNKFISNPYNNKK